MKATPNTAPVERLAYSVPGFAEAVSLSKSRVWELISEGAIKTKRCGRRVLIQADEARRFLENLDAA